MSEPRTARLTMPSQTAPLSARPSRQTAPLTIKPPSLGQYLYWDNRSSGHRLDYRKRNAASLTGWDYLYLGYWSRADMLALVLKLSADDLLQVLRAEANRNAKLYLKRKEEKDNA